jgi:hypothetical protein
MALYGNKPKYVYNKLTKAVTIYYSKIIKRPLSYCWHKIKQNPSLSITICINLLLAFSTLGLLIVTYQYVQVTRESLETLRNEVRIIDKDYNTMRSYPELHLFNPTETTKEGKKGIDITVHNSGFQATGVKIKPIFFNHDGIPNPIKIAPLYSFGGKPYYLDEDIFRGVISKRV